MRRRLAPLGHIAGRFLKRAHVTLCVAQGPYGGAVCRLPSQALSEGMDVTCELPAHFSLSSRRAWASTALHKLMAHRGLCWLYCQEAHFPLLPAVASLAQVARSGPHCRCPLSAQHRPGISV